MGGVGVGGLKGEGEAFALGDGAELADEGLCLALVAEVEEGPDAEPTLVAAAGSLEDLEGGAGLLALLGHEVEVVEVQADGPLDDGDGVGQRGGAGDLRVGGRLGVHLEVSGGALEAGSLGGVEDVGGRGRRGRGGRGSTRTRACSGKVKVEERVGASDGGLGGGGGREELGYGGGGEVLLEAEVGELLAVEDEGRDEVGDSGAGGEAEARVDGGQGQALHLEDLVGVVDRVELAHEVQVGDERQRAHLGPQGHAAALGAAVMAAVGAEVLQLHEDRARLVDGGRQHLRQLQQVRRQRARVHRVQELVRGVVQVRDRLVVDREPLRVQRQLQECPCPGSCPSVPSCPPRHKSPIFFHDIHL